MVVGVVAAVSLIVVFLVLNSADQVESGSWVTVDNIQYRNSESVFYVLEKKSPFGENEKFEDSEGYRRICLLLEFAPVDDGSTGSDKSYVALPFDGRQWELCRQLVLTDKPEFDTSTVPVEFRAEIAGS